MATTGRRDLTNANEVEHWSIPVLGKTRSASGLKESRLIVIEDSEAALEILIRPAAPGIDGPGYLHTLNVVIVILVWAFWMPWWAYPSHMSDAGWFINITYIACGVFFIGCLLFQFIYPQYLAGLWTRLRVADGMATIWHPNWRGKDLVTEFRLTGAAKYPKERYSAAHHLQLSGGEKPFVCWPPLPYEQITWLIETIQPRIQTNNPPAPSTPTNTNQTDLVHQ